MCTKIFYITYGYDQLFRNGWSKVYATSKDDAIAKLLDRHPVCKDMDYSQIFCHVYSRQEFMQTEMWQKYLKSDNNKPDEEREVI